MSLKIFEEFLKKGIVKKQTPEKSRSNFLVMDAEKDYKYLLKLVDKMGFDDLGLNNYVKLCYDILMGLIRAKMTSEGYKASGFGAHEAEVSYFERIGFPEKDVQFLNKMRFFRNKILYYGTILDKEYVEKVIKFTKKNYPVLRKLVGIKK